MIGICDICKEPTESGDLESYFHHGCAGYPYCSCDISHNGDCGIGMMKIDEKVKEKAQEVRLALLGQLSEETKPDPQS